MRYVLGFLFTPQNTHVALVQKTRPDFQKGLWNGIGGKMWLNEKPASTMARESYEETGAANVSWHEYGTWMYSEGRVHLYRATATQFELKKVLEEQAQWIPVSQAISGNLPMLSNTRWFLAAALDPNLSFIQAVDQPESWAAPRG